MIQRDDYLQIDESHYNLPRGLHQFRKAVALISPFLFLLLLDAIFSSNSVCTDIEVKLDDIIECHHLYKLPFSFKFHDFDS